MENTLNKNSSNYIDVKENKNLANNYFCNIICDSFYYKDYYFYPFFNNFSKIYEMPVIKNQSN